MKYTNTTLALHKIGEDIVEKMGNILLKNNKLATRQLYNSLDYGIIPRKGIPTLYIKYASYGKFVDKKTSFNKGKGPPISVLKQWLKDKKIPVGQGKERNIGGKNFKKPSNDKLLTSMAFAINRKIRKRGSLNPAYHNPTNFTKPFDTWTTLKRNQELLKKALIKDMKLDLKLKK